MPPRIGSLASPEAIKNAVAAGMGIAIVSRLIIALELQAAVQFFDELSGAERGDDFELPDMIPFKW